jgi:hypothetical protein
MNREQKAEYRYLKVVIDAAAFDGYSDENGRVLAPLNALCESIDAEVKVLEGLEQSAVCRGDLCIPLNVGGADDTLEIDGDEYIDVDILAEVLGLEVTIEEDSAMVSTNGLNIGLGSGDTPPAFRLPDLYSGDPVASSDFLGRKVVFYMWASW